MITACFSDRDVCKLAICEIINELSVIIDCFEFNSSCKLLTSAISSLLAFRMRGCFAFNEVCKLFTPTISILLEASIISCLSAIANAFETSLTFNVSISPRLNVIALFNDISLLSNSANFVMTDEPILFGSPIKVANSFILSNAPLGLFINKSNSLFISFIAV